ncbi:MAG: hypothetical protein ACK56I_17365, partial [bacterium]
MFVDVGRRRGCRDPRKTLVHTGFPWVGGDPTTSPDVRCGPPVLRSLHVRFASASVPALAPIARRHGRGTPSWILPLKNFPEEPKPRSTEAFARGSRRRCTLDVYAVDRV